VTLWVNLFSLATGITIIVAQTHGLTPSEISLSHISITVSLNVSLTIAIAIRLALHRRNVCTATGFPARIRRQYEAIATMLIESLALYVMTSLLLIGLWAAGSDASEIFLPMHTEIQVRTSLSPQSLGHLSNAMILQVIAPLLIIKRVANRTALTSDAIVIGRVSTFHVRSRGGSAGGGRALSGGHPTCSAGNHGKDIGESEAV